MTLIDIKINSATECEIYSRLCEHASSIYSK